MQADTTAADDTQACGTTGRLTGDPTLNAATIRCEKHGEIINDEPCNPCHSQGDHDSQCRYLGNDAWNCGVVEGDFSGWMNTASQQ